MKIVFIDARIFIVFIYIYLYMLQLTCNAITLICKKEPQQFLIQIYNPEKMKTSNRIKCNFSDGHYFVKGFISESQKITEEDKFAIVRVRSYDLLQQYGKIYAVLVHECQKIDTYSQLIGSPHEFPKDKQPKLFSPEEMHELSQEKLLSFQTKKIEQQMKEHSQQNQNNYEESKGDSNLLQIKQVNEINLEQNEKISDLDPELPNWQIAVKIVKKTYKDFMSKQGKETKLMSLELMDKAGMIICAAMFGDDALKYYNTLKQGELYLVTRGKIREDDYQHNKSKMHSKYSILLTLDTQFKRIKNPQVHIEPQKKTYNIKQIIQKEEFAQSIDVVAVVVSIHPQNEFEKSGKIMKRQNIEVCDPQNRLIMEATIWNRKIDISTAILNKTVCLCGFKLYSFNGRYTLSSSYNSTLKILDKHPYSYSQKKIITNQMENVSEIKQLRKDDEEPCKNLKQLFQEIEYLEKGEQIKSSLNLFLTQYKYDKWYYESCPNCRKSASRNLRCVHCGKEVQETIPRYKLTVEMSDSTGSIWATGFEQFGVKLFEDTQGMQYLQELDGITRQNIFKKNLYKEYSLKLTTKMDDFNNLKHTITKISNFDLMPNIYQSIHRIKEHLSYSMI